MNWMDLLRMSINNLKRRKLRTFLTVLGVMIGTTSIVVMISLGLGLQQAMQQEIENVAQDLPDWEDKQRREIASLKEKFIKIAVKQPIDDLRKKYKGNKNASDFLRNVQNHIITNYDDFLPEPPENNQEEGGDAISALLSRMNKNEEDKFAKF